MLARLAVDGTVVYNQTNPIVPGQQSGVTEIVSYNSSAPTTLARFFDLQPFACYRLSVTINTAAGPSPEHKQTACTPESLPATPVSVRILSRPYAGDLRNVTWSMPTFVGGNIIVFEVIVGYDDATGELGRKVYTGPSNVTYAMLANDLIRTYHGNIRVRATTKVGSGPLSDMAVDMRRTDTPPSARGPNGNNNYNNNGAASKSGAFDQSTATGRAMIATVTISVSLVVLAVFLIARMRARSAAMAGGLHFPLPDKWEVPRESLVIEEAIGAGAFGTVHRGGWVF